MARKGPKWDKARAFLDQHPDGTAQDLSHALGISRRSASDYLAGVRAERGLPPPERAPTKKPRQPTGAPVETMAPDDRQRVLGIVRDSYATIAHVMKVIRQAVESTDVDVPRIDRDTAQALLNLQRTASGLVEAHPGLMELAKANDDGVGDKGTLVGPDALERLQAALRGSRQGQSS